MNVTLTKLALVQQRFLTHFHSHSVLEQIQIKGSYPEQRLPQHESLYPIGYKFFIMSTEFDKNISDQKPP